MIINNRFPVSKFKLVSTKNYNNRKNRFMQFKRIVIVFLLSTIVSACGADSQNQPTLEPTPNPTSPTATAPKIVAFDYVQKAKNKAYKATQVQSASFSNATGVFRLPLADQSLTGNVTISVDLEDPDGINNVYVGFAGGTKALELCATDCGVAYRRTVTGINPLDYGQSSGPQQLQLWVQDTQGNKTFLTNVSFIWNKTVVTGLNAERTVGNIELSWNALNNYLRYNVYIASQAGVTHENYQALADGQAFLALRDPQKVLSGKEDDKAFFTAVTAIDGSGESAFSETLKVSALSGAEDFAPTAGNDNYFMDEDTTLIENVLTNDSDLESQTLTISTAPIRQPENGTLTINADGTINYIPTADFVGRDNFSYRISDGLGQTAEAVVIITVNQVNDPPEASFNNFNLIDQARGKNHNAPVGLSNSHTLARAQAQAQALLAVAAPGLLINDLDIDGNSISVVTTPVVEPTQGTVTLNADGSFEYTNNPGSSGEDSFSYHITDGTTVSDPPTVVRITINGASFFPVAANDHYTLIENQTFVADNSAVGRMSILNNDSDLDTGDELSIITNFVRSVAHGTLNMGADGTFTYIPTPGYYGTDSFIYQITDLQGNTAQAGGTFTITRSNEVPIAITDDYALTEDSLFSADTANGLLGNDSDVDLDPITVDSTPAQAPINGQLTLETDGSFVYIPNANFAGSDSFSYLVSDDRGGVSTGTVTLTIINVNDIPIANDDTVQTILNTPITINVLSNDSDIENQALTVTNAIVTAGTVAINVDNTLTYTPTTGFLGKAEIDYAITDGAGGNTTAKVFVSVDNVNLAPVAANDDYALNEDQALNVNGNNLPLLTANDTDPNGDTLTVNTTAQTNPANGSVTLAADGTFSYQPNANFFGSDSFTYQILDGRGGSATATVNLTIASVNDAPLANPDSIATSEETLININPLRNDSDVENDTLTLINAVTNNGTATVQSNNTLNYTPVMNFVGVAQVSYLVSDNNGGTATGIISVTVLNINVAPVALDDTANTQENTAVNINVLANDSDIDGDTLVVLNATVSNPTNGTVSANADNTLLFTPTTNFNGNASVNYTISDNNGGIASATVTVNVISVNSTPVAVNDYATTDEDTLVTINVLANDSDVDGDALMVTDPTATNGTVSVSLDSSIDYLPNANFNGSDTISYNVNDGNGATDSATVTVTITAVNDAPIGVADTAVTNEDNAINIIVLANDTDIDTNATALTVTAVLATNGTTTVLPNQTIDYNPTLNFNGVDTISYTVNDDLGGSSSTTVSLTIVAQNDAPVAVDDTSSTDEDTLVAINVLANDSDIDGDTLSIDAAQANSGTVTVNADNSLSYTPISNFNGADTISYTLIDVGGLTVSASVAVTVNPVNDSPIALSSTATTTEDVAISIVVLANDSDIDGDALTVSTASANNGSVTVNSVDQSLNYSPKANFNGEDTINYSIDDGNGGSASASVLVTVLVVNDAPVISGTPATEVAEDAGYSFTPTVSDIDAMDTATFKIVNQPSWASFDTATGALTGSPENKNVGTTSDIVITVSDSADAEASLAAFSITVSNTNDAPVAVADAYSVDEGNTLNVNATASVLNNDSDIDADSVITTVLVNNVNNGTLTLNLDGSFDYIHDGSETITDSFTYKANDTFLDSNAVTVTLTINPKNDAPQANDDVVIVDEDATVPIDVLANDFDSEDFLLPSSTSVVTAPSNGATSINTNNGVITYTPSVNFNGPDSFTYQVSDSQDGTSNIATVSINVESVNDAPVMVNDIQTINEDVAILIDILANDTDVDTDDKVSTISIDTQPSNGRVTIVDDKVRYEPTSDFNGTDNFTYHAQDSTGTIGNTATVTINITGENDLPFAVNDSANTDEDTPVTIDVLVNDSDVDGEDDIDRATVSMMSAPAKGSLSIDSDNGAITYTPNANINGEDSFTYVVKDTDDGTSNEATVNITINPINDAPVANNDIVSNVVEDITYPINVLGNDSDIENSINSATVSIASAPGQGTVSVDPATGVISYTPGTNYFGNDSFTYSVSDNEGGSSNPATVTITVSNVNDAPTIDSSAISTVEEDALYEYQVAASDIDNGDSLTINSSTPLPSWLILSDNGDGSANLVGTPDNDAVGEYDINLTVTDGSGASDTQAFTLTVINVNDVPIINSSVISTVEEDTLYEYQVAASDIDNGDSLTISSSTPLPSWLILSDNGDGSASLMGTPDNNAVGEYDINLTVTDDSSASDSQAFTLTVINVNDAPIAENDNATATEDTQLVFTVLNNDSDPDGDTLTIATVSANNGTVTVNSADQSLNYSPNANFNGSDTINYTISDGNGGTATALVMVTVNGINDAPVANDDNANVNEDSNINISVLENDNDVDGDTLTITAATATSGAVTIDNGISLTYTPNVNFSGTDTINYTISDGQGASASSSVSVTISAVNDIPIANADIASTNEDTSVNIDVLANDIDVDGDTLTITAATATSGAVTIDNGISLTYTPNVNFNGSDTIDYTMSDDNGGTATAIVTVSVVSVNDAPTYTDGIASIAENVANNTTVLSISAADIDGDNLTYSIQSGNTDGIFAIEPNTGDVIIADNLLLNYELATEHVVTFKVTDDGVGSLSATATGTITVTNVEENVTPTLDTAFGTSGTAGSNAFAAGRFDLPKASVIDASGKLVVVGRNNYSGPLTEFFITRFNTDGTLDRSFGHQGLVTEDFGFQVQQMEAIGVTIDSFGNIIIIGNIIFVANDSRNLVFTARYTHAGVLDTTFHSGFGYHYYSEITVETTATDAVLDADNNILIAGHNTLGDFSLIKFSADGNTHVDTTLDFFNGTDIAHAIVLQSDGKALIVGTVREPACQEGSTLDDFGIARFDVSSTPFLDTSYNATGMASFDFGNSQDDSAFDAYINNADEVVMTGASVHPTGNQTDFAALKIDSSGTLITGFGTNGLLVVDIDGDGTGTSNQSTGTTVASDSSNNLYFGIYTGISNFDTVIYKTDANGSVDNTYGTSGQATFGLSDQENTAEDLQIDSSNRAVLLTTTTTVVEPDVVVARYTSAGILDSSFSVDGFNTLDATFSVDTLSELIELSVAPHAGKFVAVGTTVGSSGSVLIVARYNADGSQDETFGINGYYVHVSVESNIVGQDIVELSDGKLVVVGSFDEQGLVVMLKTDGTLETSFNETSFNHQGSKLLSSGSQLSFNAVAVDSNNKIVVAGTDGYDVYIARMSVSGTLDSNFGDSGEFKSDLNANETVEDIAIQSNNAIVAVGQKDNNGLVFRVLDNGTLDTENFASPNNGYATIDLDSEINGDVHTLRRIKIKSDGKIVTAGNYTIEAQPASLLVQLNSDGIVTTSYTYGESEAKALGLALDASGRILITGFNSNDTNQDIFIARIEATGVLDQMFNGTGGILFDYSSSSESAQAILVRDDGSIVIAGADKLNLFPTSFFFIQKFILVEP